MLSKCNNILQNNCFDNNNNEQLVSQQTRVKLFHCQKNIAINEAKYGKQLLVCSLEFILFFNNKNIMCNFVQSF